MLRVPLLLCGWLQSSACAACVQIQVKELECYVHYPDTDEYEEVDLAALVERGHLAMRKSPTTTPRPVHPSLP